MTSLVSILRTAAEHTLDMLAADQVVVEAGAGNCDIASVPDIAALIIDRSGEVRGAIHVSRFRAPELNDDEVYALHALADITALALERELRVARADVARLRAEATCKIQEALITRMTQALALGRGPEDSSAMN